MHSDGAHTGTRRSGWRRVMMSFVLIVASVYGLLVLAGLFLADRLMFLPQPSSYADDARIVKLTSADGATLSARLDRNPAATFTILFSHGNAEDMGQLDELFDGFKRLGFSVAAYDYSGYGTSSGRPTARGAVANIEAVYDYLTRSAGIAPERIIVWGRSVGSGPSAHLAATRKVGGLVLESGFVSAFRVMTRIRLLPFDKFDNLRAVVALTRPLLVIHGTEDEIIPFWHGRALYERASVPKMHLWVERAGHNDLAWVAGPAYGETARAFAAMIGKETHENK